MQPVEATQDHLPSWLALRRQLWPDPDPHHLQEMQEILASPSMIAFLLFDDDQEPVGFIEGALYLTASRKYGYVEGWYVIPSRRGQGWGGRLLSALEQWILHQSISLVLSDTIPEVYSLSTRAHLENGFRELMTIRVFAKQLDTDARVVP
jgi:GNAT superfamily N-acetyltransferase